MLYSSFTHAMELLWLIIIVVALAVGVGLTSFAYRKQKDAGADLSIMPASQRDQFVSIISHQLRTPLSIVKGYLDALSHEDLGKLNIEQKEYIIEALHINEEMIALVNRYIEITTKGIDGITPQYAEVDCSDIVRQIVRRHAIFARATNVDLKATVPPKILMRTDEHLLRNILDNVISNAVKYTVTSGSVTVIAKEQGTDVLISISDTGIGIPKDQHQQVFSKFFRAKNLLHRSSGGSGLGLFIVKEYVTKLHGKVWFESQEGKGSTFYISLPKQ